VENSTRREGGSTPSDMTAEKARGRSCGCGKRGSLYQGGQGLLLRGRAFSAAGGDGASRGVPWEAAPVSTLFGATWDARKEGGGATIGPTVLPMLPVPPMLPAICCRWQH
jgi:hypothetical protein